MLIGQAFQNDPRLKEGKQLILEALEDHQKAITGIRPAQMELKQNYDALLQQFAQYRGGKLWFPFIGSGIGKGALVELLDGSIKYDFISGIGPHFFGHSHPLLMDAALDAAFGDTIMQGHLQQNRDAVELSGLLIKASGMDHCFLCSSGVLANENALKLAFQKNYPANRVLAFEHCFVGRTLAAAQITDKPSFRDGLPHTLNVDYIPYYDVHRPEESTAKAVAILKQHLQRYPKQHAIMVVELVQGEGGFNVGSTTFFRNILEIVKNEGIAVFADEVQTFGRTYDLFAYQYFELQDLVDIVSIGKLSQVCATLFKKSFVPRPGLLSQTFTASTSAILAGKVLIDSLIHDDFFGPNGKNAKIFKRFAHHFETLHQKHPQLIQGPWGIGAMIAFTPIDGSTESAVRFVHKLFESGVMGFIAGSNPTRIRFLVPAGAVTMEDIDQACAIIEENLIHELHR